MEPFDYQDLFHEPLQKAFAATNPAVRTAYFELATFYRRRLGNDHKVQPSGDALKKIAARARARGAAAPQVAATSSREP